MNFWELILISICLSMDAFAVAVCQGMTMKYKIFSQSLIIALFFGGFQAIMPTIGYFIGNHINSYLMSFNKIIAFLLLALIGIKMIYETIKNKNSCENPISQLNIKTLILLATATSIDALAVGIGLAILKAPILFSVSVIGLITFLLSLSGTILGFKFKNSLKGNTEIIGGIVLFIIGLKILIL